MLAKIKFSSNSSGQIDRARRLRQKPNASVHVISVPTPVLFRGDAPVSPNRTNYFPTPQLMLASSTQHRLEAEGIPWSVHFGDYKSIPDMDTWQSDLRPYEEFQYAPGWRLTKCYVGDGIERLSRELADADVVCITANFTLEARSVVEAIAALRRADPGKLILVGGRDAMARPDFFLRKGADLVAHGDADHSLPELLVRLYRGESLNGVVSDSNRLFDAGGRIQLDRLPFMRFDYLKYPLTRYCESGGGRFLESVLNRGGVAYFETSRGCFRECDYCTERLTKHSAMSVQRFKDEVAWYKANGVATLMLSDDNLLQRLNLGERGERELIEMFEYLRDENMIWEFPVGVEIGRLMTKKGNGEFHERLFDLMFWNNDDPDHFAGAFRGLIPFENVLSSETDDAGVKLSKMRTLDENFRILERVITAGLPQVNLAVMIGFPHDTAACLESTRQNLEAVMNLRERTIEASPRRIATYINYSLFAATPFPGTPYFEEMREAKRLEYDIEEHPELWSLYTSVVRGDTFRAARTTEHRRELLELTRSNHAGGKVRLHMGSGDDALPCSQPTNSPEAVPASAV